VAVPGANAPCYLGRPIARQEGPGLGQRVTGHRRQTRRSPAEAAADTGRPAETDTAKQPDQRPQAEQADARTGQAERPDNGHAAPDTAPETGLKELEARHEARLTEQDARHEARMSEQQAEFKTFMKEQAAEFKAESAAQEARNRDDLAESWRKERRENNNNAH
jgi:hypothetical protein